MPEYNNIYINGIHLDTFFKYFNENNILNTNLTKTIKDAEIKWFKYSLTVNKNIYEAYIPSYFKIDGSMNIETLSKYGLTKDYIINLFNIDINNDISEIIRLYQTKTNNLSIKQVSTSEEIKLLYKTGYEDLNIPKYSPYEYSFIQFNGDSREYYYYAANVNFKDKIIFLKNNQMHYDSLNLVKSSNDERFYSSYNNVKYVISESKNVMGILIHNQLVKSDIIINNNQYVKEYTDSYGKKFYNTNSSSKLEDYSNFVRRNVYGINSSDDLRIIAQAKKKNIPMYKDMLVNNSLGLQMAAYFDLKTIDFYDYSDDKSTSISDEDNNVMLDFKTNLMPSSTKIIESDEKSFLYTILNLSNINTVKVINYSAELFEPTSLKLLDHNQKINKDINNIIIVIPKIQIGKSKFRIYEKIKDNSNLYDTFITDYITSPEKINKIDDNQFEISLTGNDEHVNVPILDDGIMVKKSFQLIKSNDTNNKNIFYYIIIDGEKYPLERRSNGNYILKRNIIFEKLEDKDILRYIPGSSTDVKSHVFGSIVEKKNFKDRIEIQPAKNISNKISVPIGQFINLNIANFMKITKDTSKDNSKSNSFIGDLSNNHSEYFNSSNEAYIYEITSDKYIDLYSNKLITHKKYYVLPGMIPTANGSTSYFNSFDIDTSSMKSSFTDIINSDSIKSKYKFSSGNYITTKDSDIRGNVLPELDQEEIKRNHLKNNLLSLLKSNKESFIDISESLDDDVNWFKSMYKILSTENRFMINKLLGRIQDKTRNLKYTLKNKPDNIVLHKEKIKMIKDDIKIDLDSIKLTDYDIYNINQKLNKENAYSRLLRYKDFPSEDLYKKYLINQYKYKSILKDHDRSYSPTDTLYTKENKNYAKINNNMMLKDKMLNLMSSYFYNDFYLVNENPDTKKSISISYYLKSFDDFYKNKIKDSKNIYSGDTDNISKKTSITEFPIIEDREIPLDESYEETINKLIKSADDAFNNWATELINLSKDKSNDEWWCL